jgi:acyl-CoA thioesterase I
LRSQVLTPADVAEKALAIVRSTKRYNDVLPLQFIEKMKHHHGTSKELDEYGIYRKNPLIVAFGDSVTAGWFEGNTLFPEAIRSKFLNDAKPVEHITDIGNVYHEVFKLMLSEKYERTSVSVVNSGISGDSVVGMNTRIERDVIRYFPDLVLLNASLNGPEDVNLYEKNLRQIAIRLKNDTQADVIFITPNLVSEGMKGTLDQRVSLMLKIANEFGFCIADTYSTWQEIQKQGIDITLLLANTLNHPTITGHQIYAMELMKLFS